MNRISTCKGRTLVIQSNYKPQKHTLHLAHVVHTRITINNSLLNLLTENVVRILVLDCSLVNKSLYHSLIIIIIYSTRSNT